MKRLRSKILAWFLLSTLSVALLGGRALHLASVAHGPDQSIACSQAAGTAAKGCCSHSHVELPHSEGLQSAGHSHSDDCAICQFYIKGQVDTRADLSLAEAEVRPEGLQDTSHARPALVSRAYSARGPPHVV